MVGKFSLKALCSTMYGKNFQIYRVHIPRKCFIGEFLLMPLPTQNSPPSSCHHAPDRMKLLIPPRSILSKICFPQQQKGVEKTMICITKVQSENKKMT